jgi:hypothetical protein
MIKSKVIQDENAVLKINPKSRKCNNLPDLEALSLGDIVLLGSSNMAKIEKGVYEGFSYGQDSFIRGEFEGEIVTWKCPRENIMYLNGAVILDQLKISTARFSSDSSAYRVKKAMLLLAGLEER